MSKRAAVLVGLVLVSLLAPSMLVAMQEEAMPWDTALQQILNVLQGNTVKIIGILMIIGAGLTIALTEGQGLKKLLWIVVGVGIALNAVSFLTLAFGVTEGMMLVL